LGCVALGHFLCNDVVDALADDLLL
jgi:hypothetical protein